MLTAIKSANWFFALASVFPPDRCLFVYQTPSSSSSSLCLCACPFCVPVSRISSTSAVLHCNPGQMWRHQSRSAKLQNGCHCTLLAGWDGGHWIRLFCPRVRPASSDFPSHLWPKDVRSILRFCKRLSPRILFALLCSFGAPLDFLVLQTGPLFVCVPRPCLPAPPFPTFPPAT